MAALRDDPTGVPTGQSHKPRQAPEGAGEERPASEGCFWTGQLRSFTSSKR